MHLLSRPTAVDQQTRARYQAGRVACQEHDGAHYVGNFTEAAERDPVQRIAGSSRNGTVIGVEMKVGPMALTRML